ncbi:hypothetical protein LTS17_001181 [Exophiala oligosperma]
MPSPKDQRTKSPTYSHLLYLSETDRQIFTTVTSSSSFRSSRSVHSYQTDTTAVSASTPGTSRMSIQRPRFADDHYPLITTIHPETVPDYVPINHAALWCARQMAQIHNIMIRALNSAWNHAVGIQPSTREAEDFLFFNQQICSTLEHHHRTEDEYFFPTLEAILGRPSAIEKIAKAHESFAEGLAIYQKYVFLTKASEYNGVTLKHIIEAFAPDLIQHLHDEIPALVALHVLDSKTVMKVWKSSEQLPARYSDVYVLAPWMLGCQDKSFTIDGHKADFPEMPWVVEFVAKGWFARRHAGAWRFCPSDLNGRRRQIYV